MNAFAQRFFQHQVFFEIEVANCVLQITHSPMDHLRGRAGSAAGKILSFELHRLQTAKLRIEREAGSCRASAEYAHVETLPFHGLDGFFAAFHAAIFSKWSSIGLN